LKFVWNHNQDPGKKQLYPKQKNGEKQILAKKNSFWIGAFGKLTHFSKKTPIF
jgi:hypothetical protein